MRIVHVVLLAAAAVLAAACAAPTGPGGGDSRLADRYRGVAAALIDAARTRSLAHARLQHLCDRIGHRLSGSAALGEAVRWCEETMRADGLDGVRTEEVMVPAWIRGRESAVLLEPAERPLAMLGLGNSVGTPVGGIAAEVVVAADFDALAALGESVRGRIVLFNRPMPAFDPETGSGYGEAVPYRVSGPSRAAAMGAVAVLVRSLTATSLRTPHTGMLRYLADAPRVPAAAISVEDAEMLARFAASGERVVVRLSMEARFGPDVASANVVGEILGSEDPGEVVVMGGHLDSWDVGQGAHDDGGSCVAAMEALRLIRSLGLRPRRTLRVVLWVNEENGLRGARAYAEAHAAELKDHVAAIEADSGSYRPLGFTTPPAKDARGERMRARLREVVALLDPVGAGALLDGGGGADIGPMEPAGVPQIGLMVDESRYFDIHHTEADTFDKVVKEELDLCAAALAVVGFVIADMPERLVDPPQ